MLTPEQWNEVGKQASKIYSGLELELIQEIAERIANTGLMNEVARNDAMIAQEAGMLYQDVVEAVAKYNNSSVSQILEIFETAGVKSLKFDDSIYKEAGFSPLPIKQSKSMLQILQSSALKTGNNLDNLVMTTAKTSQTAFYDAMNTAYMEVITGTKSYSGAILDAINKVSKNGVPVEYPSGYKTSIENACRMNVVTGVNQTCGKLQEMRADEMGWDLMELTAHPGARPEHEVWQGQIVSRSGQKGYLSFADIGYGKVDGFKGVNCRHDWYPYYEGSSRTFNNAELQDLKQQKVTYNGQEITVYDAQQLQRKMERRIRQDKKDIAALNGILTSNTKDSKLIEDAQNKLLLKKTSLKEHNLTLNDLLNQTGLAKDNSRLAVGNIKINTIKDKISAVNQWKNFKTMDEAKKYVYTHYKDSDIDKIKNVESINTTFKILAELQKQYPLKETIFVRNKTMSSALANGNYQGININTSHFNKATRKALFGDDWIENLNTQIKELKQYLGNVKYKQKPIQNGIKRLEEQKKFKCYSISGSYSDLESIKATISHEYGHVLADQYFGQINKFKANKDFDYFDSNECWQKCEDVSKVYYEALKNGDIYDISCYASKDQYEFFAECFAKKQMGEALPDYINKMLERVLKLGK